jgi:hypothetical protein
MPGRKVELGAVRYGVLDWHGCESLREAIELARALAEWNEAYPYQIRVDGVVRWERLPDEHLNFRWARVRVCV